MARNGGSLANTGIALEMVSKVLAGAEPVTAAESVGISRGTWYKWTSDFDEGISKTNVSKLVRAVRQAHASYLVSMDVMFNIAVKRAKEPQSTPPTVRNGIEAAKIVRERADKTQQKREEDKPKVSSWEFVEPEKTPEPSFTISSPPNKDSGTSTAMPKDTAVP